jgi:hypothetical protein
VYVPTAGGLCFGKINKEVILKDCNFRNINNLLSVSLE